MGRTIRVVPKQWVQYEAVGAQIPNTRFVVFKTPLRNELSTRIPKEKRFSVIDLMRTVAERGQTLGMIVDLTDTDRYYDKGDVEGMCIVFEKLNCPGRGFVERDDLVESFNTIVDSFVDANADNDSVIGVHCTNGVNRSGYLVCRFLIDRLGWSSHDAIDAFERARGYAIERGSYVQALHRAAKERRTKKRHKHTEEVVSSEESEVQRQSRKRAKHKKKRKGDVVSGDDNGTSDGIAMEAVLNQMALAFEQHESMAAKPSAEASGKYSAGDAGSSLDGGMHHSLSASHLFASNSPYVGSTGTAEMDDEEDSFSWDQEMTPLDDDGDNEKSRSWKRRERRIRLKKQFDLMKTGNFWKINEMQKEKFKGN